MSRRPILATTNVLVRRLLGGPGGPEILLGLRADCGKWETPGGKVEEETVVYCAKREMKEETGIDLLGSPEVIGYTDGWEWSGSHGKDWYVVVHFGWKSWCGNPLLVEGKHLDWKWWPVNRLPDLAYGTASFAKNILPGYLNRLYQTVEL